MRTSFLALLVALAAGPAVADGATRRPTRCCIMVPAESGGERPYCFVLNVRPAHRGRRICRLVGGVPQRRVRAAE